MNKLFKNMAKGVVRGAVYAGTFAVLWNLFSYFVILKPYREAWLTETHENNPLIVDAISYTIDYEDIE